jgi:two-component system, chemotaxis family, CheB/CheR fusion protein
MSDQGTKPKPETHAAPYLYVGIGASAGGFDALQKLFKAMPAPSSMCFIVVQHLDPAGEGLLIDLIGKATSLKVMEAADQKPLAPGYIYVVPPHSSLCVRDGVFHLDPARGADYARAPIDFLFHSLAESCKSSAVGVILSGNGTDGALGIKAINDAGGMTLAQEPSTAKYDSMPQAAATTGAADYVLPPEKMPDELVAYAKHVHALAEEGHDRERQEQIIEALADICEILRESTDHNFRHYKTSTLVRRVGRRMQVLRIAAAGDYIAYLRQTPGEAQALIKEILIGVTSFFRDPEVFEALSQQALPQILSRRDSPDPVRIWVPGCASGEEAYTIAMLVREALDKLEPKPEVQIFATDINERSLHVARNGAYPASIADEMSPERLKRFFTRRGAQYIVNKEIRELCLFSSHDLIRDPPFSRLDLISCRNLLIYFGPHLQKKLVPLFHYALKPGGFLLLGPSESISAHRDLFRPVDAKNRLSQRVSTAMRPVNFAISGEKSRGIRTPAAAANCEADLGVYMQRVLLDEFSPKAIVVNEEGNLLCVSGGMDKYLGLAPGNFQNNVVQMAKAGLRVALRSALSEAVKSHRVVVHEDVMVETGEHLQRVRLTVQPMPQMGEETGIYMIVFQDVGAPVATDRKLRTERGDAEELIDQLERELRTTRDDLEKTIQDLEVTNEEIKSSNEELISMNEELQSANEELESSKEEIQAANDALGRANSDLENLLSSTQIATIFLDDDKRIKRYTQPVADIYNVMPTDIGRPISHITHNAESMPPFPEPSTLSKDEKRIDYSIRAGSRWYVRRVLPYFLQNGEREGMVVTFSDVTAMKEIAHALELSNRNFSQLAELVPQFVWTADAKGGFDYFNQRWYDYTGMRLEDGKGDGWVASVHPDDRERVTEGWAKSVATGEPFEIEYRLRGADGAYKWFLRRAVPLKENGKVVKWFGTSTNIDRQKQAQELLREADRQKNDFIAMLAHELRNPLAPILNASYLLGRKAAQDAELHRVQEIIRRQVQHMRKLLDDLLDVARITRDKIKLEKEPVDLRDVVRTAVETSQPMLDAKHHTLKLDTKREALFVEGDQTRLAQIVVNILNNAAKFTPEGGTINLGLGRFGDQAVITVRDNGVGMTPEMLQRAFELFAQADHSLDRAQGGLGIGLSLVRRIVQLHNGTVEAFSPGLGHGSEFVVRLPLVAAPEKAADAAKAPKTTRAPRRILVVDDNVDSAETLGMLLEIENHTVALAHDGLSACATAESFRPDIILLDIGLPQMNGYEVAARLRAQPEFSGVTLVAVSGYGQDTDRAKAFAAGFDEYLVKPVDAKALRAIVAGETKRG